MKRFIMNNYLWKVMYVPSDSEYLIDRTGALTVATTDPMTLCIYMSNELFGEFKIRVLLHELSHVMMFSYGYIDDIHRMVYPEYWIEAEEFICNLIANHLSEIYEKAYAVLGDDAIHTIPHYIEEIAF